MTEFSVPDAIEPIAAWRYWRVGSADRRLQSLTGRHQGWQPGQALEARCRFDNVDRSEWRYQLVSGFSPDPHPAPSEGCTCGLYAARSLEHLRGQPLFGLSRMVVGEVSLWGKVIPGQHGYRAQFAYPRRLYLFEGALRRDPRLLEALARYEVPIEVTAERQASFSPRLALARALHLLAR
ncbi:MAG: hypothetical protein ACT4PX_05365 [Actinomycetota bacterium]